MKAALCAYAYVICILIQYWILVIVHSWQIPKAVPGGPGIGWPSKVKRESHSHMFIITKN